MGNEVPGGLVVAVFIAESDAIVAHFIATRFGEIWKWIHHLSVVIDDTLVRESFPSKLTIAQLDYISGKRDAVGLKHALIAGTSAERENKNQYEGTKGFHATLRRQKFDSPNNSIFTSTKFANHRVFSKKPPDVE